MTEHIDIIPFNDTLSSYFKDLNVAWLQKYFYVEPIDEEILAQPRAYIIEKGGYIFFAVCNSEVVGTCALIQTPNGQFELAKMAVDEKFQGKKIGHKLLQTVIAKAEEIGLSNIILYSNTRLESAIHLYKKFGFTEVPVGNASYKRSDIKMEKELSKKSSSIKDRSSTRAMTRLEKLFEQKKQNVINLYCTAGYPHLNSTTEVLEALQNSGVDLIELGMPYSDPLADGPVIQASGLQALQNGMTIATLFDQLKDFRKSIHLPVILMGYLNPILQYGFEAFCAKSAEVGIDGFIIPDIPMYEYESHFKTIIEKYGLHFIFLVTPETSEERIRQLDRLSTGFLYAVSSSSITGSDKDFAPVETYLQRLQAMELVNPVLVGFGIKDRKTFSVACRYAAGAIIGTAYIKALDGSRDIAQSTTNFLNTILNTEPAGAQSAPI